MRLTKIPELGSSLEKLLSTLKKNREAVSPDVLRTYYRQPYEALLRQIGGTATAFVKAVLTDRLILNPDFINEQISVINRVIAGSGMEKQMSLCISRTYSASQLYQMALELRQNIEYALWPYINLKTCLVFDLEHPETAPVIYNTLTRQIYHNCTWMNQEIEEIYRRQLRFYWEIDFINRCIDRRQDESGLCNLPYETLAKEKAVLDKAYEIYNKKEDSNTAYNVTLDLVIDEIEQLIKNAKILQNRIAEPEVNG